MKIIQLNYLTALLFCCLIVNSFSSSSKGKSMNVLNILNLPSVTYSEKVLFISRSITNKTPDYTFNMLDYKIIQITNTDINIYKTTRYGNGNSISTSNFLVKIKLNDIDLPCNDYLFLCTLGEFKRKYSSELYGVNFNTNSAVVERMGDKADTHCIILTEGPFNSISDLPYICLEV